MRDVERSGERINRLRRINRQRDDVRVKEKEARQKYWKENKAKELARSKRYKHRHSVYAKRNPAKMAAKVMLRHARKRKATPPWLTKAHIVQIERIYVKAAELTAQHGTRYEVDHIFPIKGINFCGLHVPWNLQILRGIENGSKSNSAPVPGLDVEGDVETFEWQ